MTSPHIPLPAKGHFRDLQERIGAANRAKGFHDRGDKLRKVRVNAGAHFEPTDDYRKEVEDDYRDYIVARLALIPTEVAEAIEEVRDGRGVTETYYNDDKPGKPEGVPSELADVVIRALDLAEEWGINLIEVIDEKLAYNATRARMHGRTM
jgi:NTP pyrophosphatase (non-canonical NTP hydrolase)